MKTIKTEDEEIAGYTLTNKLDEIIRIYNIGKTTVTPDPDAVKAVEDYIKEN